MLLKVWFKSNAPAMLMFRFAILAQSENTPCTGQAVPRWAELAASSWLGQVCFLSTLILLTFPLLHGSDKVLPVVVNF